MSCFTAHMVAAMATHLENPDHAAAVFSIAHRLGQSDLNADQLHQLAIEVLTLTGSRLLPDGVGGRDRDTILCEACGHASHRMRTMEVVDRGMAPTAEWCKTKAAVEAYARYRSIDAILASLRDTAHLGGCVPCIGYTSIERILTREDRGWDALDMLREPLDALVPFGSD